VLQLAVPAIAALLSPLALLRWKRAAGAVSISFADEAIAPFLAATAVGILPLVVYDFCFVHLLGMGHWYMPVPVLFVSLLALSAIERRPAFTRPATALVTVVAKGTLVVCFFVRLHRHRDYHQKYARFFSDNAPLLRERFAADPPKLLEFDDGVVSWATGFPAMSATGFGLDAEAAKSLEKGELLEKGWDRGFRSVTSVAYFGGGNLSATPTAEELTAWAHDVWQFPGLADWHLSLLWKSPTSELVIVGIDH
jgi:hypothetical protein